MENWHEQWVSPARFSTYLKTAGQDRAIAKRLYEWNAELSASFLSDLSHLEVGLRNVATSAIDPTGEWVQPKNIDKLFPDKVKNVEVTRKSLIKAHQDALPYSKPVCHGSNAQHSTNCVASSGKIIAELSFGFWAALTRSQFEKSIWVPNLHRAFPKGSSRSEVFDRLQALNRFRNRVAHHEHVMNDPASNFDAILVMTERLSLDSHTYLLGRSRTAEIIANKPA